MSEMQTRIELLPHDPEVEARAAMTVRRLAGPDCEDLLAALGLVAYPSKPMRVRGKPVRS